MEADFPFGRGSRRSPKLDLSYFFSHQPQISGQTPRRDLFAHLLPDRQLMLFHAVTRTAVGRLAKSTREYRTEAGAYVKVTDLRQLKSQGVTCWDTLRRELPGQFDRSQPHGFAGGGMRSQSFRWFTGKSNPRAVKPWRRLMLPSVARFSQSSATGSSRLPLSFGLAAVSRSLLLWPIRNFSLGATVNYHRFCSRRQVLVQLQATSGVEVTCLLFIWNYKRPVTPDNL